jgi:hypothetical protein
MTQGNTERTFAPLKGREKWLTGQINNIAITIHQRLGQGLLECDERWYNRNDFMTTGILCASVSLWFKNASR